MNQVLAALRDAPHTSVSAIKAYMMCPMKYAHRYVYKTEASHRAVALVLGGAVHDALEAFYSFLRDEHAAPPVDFLTDAFSSSWNLSLVGDPPVQADDLGEEKDTGIALVRAFYEQAPRPRVVLGVEEPFAIPLDGDSRLLVGAMDALVVDDAGRVVIVEAKTAKRRWSEDQLRYDLQPTIYQLAARHLKLTTHAIRFDFLMKLKKPCMYSEEVSRTPAQEREAMSAVKQILRAVDADVFYPVRGWACEGCEFAAVCG